MGVQGTFIMDFLGRSSDVTDFLFAMATRRGEHFGIFLKWTNQNVFKTYGQFIRDDRYKSSSIR
jgi:hypothetical protein